MLLIGSNSISQTFGEKRRLADNCLIKKKTLGTPPPPLAIKVKQLDSFLFFVVIVCLLHWQLFKQTTTTLNLYKSKKRNKYNKTPIKSNQNTWSNTISKSRLSSKKLLLLQSNKQKIKQKNFFHEWKRARFNFKCLYSSPKYYKFI